MLRTCVFLRLPYISAAQLRLGACAEGHIDRAVIIFFPICITIQTLIRCYGMMIYQAKAALNNYKINPDNFEWLEIEDREDCNEIQAYMKQLTGASSVPRVFIGGSCIGGGDETSAAHRSGKLEGMLKEAGALL